MRKIISYISIAIIFGMLIYATEGVILILLFILLFNLFPFLLLYKLAHQSETEDIYINFFNKKIIKPGCKPYVNYTSNALENIEYEKRNAEYIQRTNPNFSLTSFKDHAYTVFFKFQKALSDKKINQISGFSTNNLSEKYKKKIANNDYDILLNIETTYAYLYDYVESSDGNIEKIIYQISAKGNNPRKPYKNFGKQKDYYLNTYYMEFVKNKNVKSNNTDGLLSIKCPSCGSPVKNINITSCEHCGTKINNKFLSYDWILNEICYWNEVE